MNNTLFEIPGFSNYLLGYDGSVFNKTTQQYLKGSFNPAGYCNFRLKTDKGNTLTIGRHRLMGIVFLPISGGYDGLVINHINGIKGQDNIDNLEWMTPKQNCEYSGIHHNNPKCIPILVRDLLTKEIKQFPSFLEAAKFYNVSKDFIAYRVNSKSTKLFPELRQYKSIRDNNDWYEPSKEELDNIMAPKKPYILVKDLRKNIVHEFYNLTDAALFTGLHKSIISDALNHSFGKILTGLFLIKRFDDPRDWPKIDDPYYVFDKSGSSKRIIKVLNTRTSEVKIYMSAVECADEHKLLPSTLNYRLKFPVAVVHRGGFKFRYYSDTF